MAKVFYSVDKKGIPNLRCEHAPFKVGSNGCRQDCMFCAGHGLDNIDGYPFVICPKYDNIHNSISMRVAKEILHERLLQDDQWGEQNHHPFQWLAILGEEVGEANKEALEDFVKNGVKAKFQKYRAELIQVSAVAMSMVESLDRNEGGKL
jgi:hypothetical protein